jgi:hypothetical protein
MGYGGGGCFLVKFAMKAGAQVLPPSSEYDSSKWCESGLISDQTARTRMDRPAKVSWANNSPRPSLNVMLPVSTRNLRGLFGLADGLGRMNQSRAADGAHENADTETL